MFGESRDLRSERRSPQTPGRSFLSPLQWLGAAGRRARVEPPSLWGDPVGVRVFVADMYLEGSDIHSREVP